MASRSTSADASTPFGSAAAKRKRTISKLPAKVRTALGKRGAKMARRKRRGS